MTAFLNALRGRYSNDDKITICPGYELNVPIAPTGVVKGDVGIELEVEGIGLPGTAMCADVVGSKSKAGWVAKNDGSLRGGVEYVTSGAIIYTTEIREMVGGLFKVFERNRSRLNNSNRCSTHIHVNVSDLKVNQLTSAIALWCTFQKCFIEWNGIERVSNHFCLSSRDEEGMMDAWVDFLRNGNGGGGRRDGIKYTALNILPIWTQGSLEFRCGGRPDDEDKIVWWAKICNAIVRYAANNYPNPMQLGYALSEQGPEVILRNILESANLGERTTDRIYNELTASGTLVVDAMNDFRDVQYIVYGFPWDAAMEIINSEYVPNPFSERKLTRAPKQIRLADIAMEPMIVRNPR